MDTSVTVKVTPPDGSWQTAHELIKYIAKTCKVGDHLNIEVADVFNASPKSQTGTGNFYMTGNNSYSSPSVSIQNVKQNDR